VLTPEFAIVAVSDAYLSGWYGGLKRVLRRGEARRCCCEVAVEPIGKVLSGDASRDHAALLLAETRRLPRPGFRGCRLDFRA